ncbi:MAG: right-handed parallel beta-helix repeat-containing protein [Bacteroidia bacterium]
MKTFIKQVSILLLIFSFSLSKAQTTITGPTVSGHWILAGSPYNIQSSVYIPNDSTLIIDPGVTVNFQTTFTPYIHVLGRLLAIGTPADSIYFTATDTTNGSHGIRFYGIKNTNDTSKMEYCKIQYGKASGTNYYVQNGGALLFDNWSKAIVSHCYISNCQAYASSSYGGAICCDSGSSPVLTYNTITKCIGWNGGGGISISNKSNPIISYDTITGNTASNGGGIYISNVKNYSISHNIILYNHALDGGGGVQMFGSKGTIANNTISYNWVSYGPGGGVYEADGDTLSILNNTISYNGINGQYTEGGGGIACQSTNRATIAYNIISNNYVGSTASGSNGGDGGGIYLEQALAVTISNNSIINNTAVYTSSYGNGGAIYCNNTSPLLINNTVANNWAYEGGALYCDLSSNPVSSNCIYWGDTATASGNELFQNDAPSTPGFYYCNVKGGEAAFGLNGNFYNGLYSNSINSNPKFVAPSGGAGSGFDGTAAQWGLQTGSSCIDAGDPLAPSAPTYTYPSQDLAGNPRIVICRIDIGAYENQYGISAPLNVSISGSTSVCLHDSVTLTANGATTYTWSPLTGLSSTNIASPLASPTSTTTFTVIGTSGICEGIDTVRLTVNPLPSIAINGDSSITTGSRDTLTASGGISYVWTSGSTNDTTIIKPLVTKTYTVTGTSSNGCSDTASFTVTVNPTGIGSITNSNFTSLYPNPTNNYINLSVEMQGTGKSAIVEILDACGKAVMSENTTIGNGEIVSLDVSLLAQGIYFIKVTINKDSRVLKFIKQ